MKQEKAFVWKVTLSLTLIATITALLLGAVNEWTAPKIRENDEKKTQEALIAVFPEEKDCTFAAVDPMPSSFTAAAAQGGKLIAAYRANVGGETVGYAVKVSASGSQSTIETIVGVDLLGTVTGVSVSSAAETPGIGAKVTDNVDGVLDQFIGMSGAGSLAVGKNVDAITGATVSSRGVTKCVNTALAAAESIIQSGEATGK